MKEPGYERLLAAIEGADVVVAGVPTLLETMMVLTTRLKMDARPVVLAFLRRVNAEVVAFHEGHLDVATAAYLRFGNGRDPAALNFGDCMAYAVARLWQGCRFCAHRRGFCADRYREGLRRGRCWQSVRFCHWWG